MNLKLETLKNEVSRDPVEGNVVSVVKLFKKGEYWHVAVERIFCLNESRKVHADQRVRPFAASLSPSTYLVYSSNGSRVTERVTHRGDCDGEG